MDGDNPQGRLLFWAQGATLPSFRISPLPFSPSSTILPSPLTPVSHLFPRSFYGGPSPKSSYGSAGGAPQRGPGRPRIFVLLDALIMSLLLVVLINYYNIMTTYI